MGRLEAPGSQAGERPGGAPELGTQGPPRAGGLLTRARGPLVTLPVMADCEGPELLHRTDLASHPNSFLPLGAV